MGQVHPMSVINSHAREEKQQSYYQWFFGHGRTRPYLRYYPPGTTYACKLGTRAELFPFPIFLSWLSLYFVSSHKTENDLVIITRPYSSFLHFLSLCVLLY